MAEAVLLQIQCVSAQCASHVISTATGKWARGVSGNTWYLMKPGLEFVCCHFHTHPIGLSATCPSPESMGWRSIPLSSSGSYGKGKDRRTILDKWRKLPHFSKTGRIQRLHASNTYSPQNCNLLPRSSRHMCVQISLDKSQHVGGHRGEECGGGPSGYNESQWLTDTMISHQALDLMENDAYCVRSTWLARPQGHLDISLRGCDHHLQF